MIEVKFLTLDNYTGESTLKQHAFKYKQRKRAYTRELYDGNISLCGKIMAGNENEEALSMAEIENEIVDQANCCKTCYKIYLELLEHEAKKFYI